MLNVHEIVERRHMRHAYDIALQSPDLSIQNGAIIIPKHTDQYLVTGWNHFPAGVTITPERLKRPTKYLYTEHSERSAIYHAAKAGISTLGATMYCPFFACADCGRAIIMSGIKRVVGHQKIMDATPDRWKESITVAFQMFKEAGIITDFLQGDLGGLPIIFDGKAWYP